MITDLTQGKPGKVLCRFSIPMLVSVVFQQLYNIADSVIAGKFAGEDALAAVGASYPITMIFMAIAVGSNIGCSVVVSGLFGAHDLKNMKTAVTTTFLACAVICAVITTAGLIGCSWMMQAISTPDNIFDDAALYLRIYIMGLTFLFFYNVCTGIFTALGDSKTPLYFLIASSLGNIVLDWLFVAEFHWGVAGVAWATFLAQGVSAALAMATLVMRLRKIQSGKFLFFSAAMLGKIAKIAVPSILQQSFISVGNLFIQSLVNGFGSAVIAGYSAAIKLNTFAITSFTTLANGVSSFTAQNLGAKKEERVQKGFRAGMGIAAAVAIPFTVVFFVFSRAMMNLFLDHGSELAMQTGIAFLRIVSPFYLVISVKLMADGVLRGAGAMSWFMTATFTDLVLRVILAFVFSGALAMGSIGIWVSWPVGWSVASIISFLFYYKGVWRRAPHPEEESTLESVDVAEESAESDSIV